MRDSRISLRAFKHNADEKTDTGNTFQELLWLRETADNTERYI
jgi:hypothetical protein